MNETAIAEQGKPDCKERGGNADRLPNGQFAPGSQIGPANGHKGGRPKGSPNLSTEYRRRILESILRKSDQELDAIRDADPIAFFGLGVRLAPKQVEVDLDHTLNFVTAEDASRIASRLLSEGRGEQARRNNGAALPVVVSQPMPTP